MKTIKNFFQQLRLIGGNIFYYFWLAVYIVNRKWIMLKIIEKKHLRIHFQSFLAMIHKSFEIFCVTRHTKHQYYLHHLLKETGFCSPQWSLLISFRLLLFNDVILQFKNVLLIDRNALKHFNVDYKRIISSCIIFNTCYSKRE